MLADGLLLEPELVVLPPPDDEQAASTATAARATPAVAVFWMRTRCILKEPLFNDPGLCDHGHWLPNVPRDVAERAARPKLRVAKLIGKRALNLT